MGKPYVYLGSIPVAMSGASQGLVDLGMKVRKLVVQADLGTYSTYKVLVQPVWHWYGRYCIFGVY
jgi:hypothetical protein